MAFGSVSMVAVAILTTPVVYLLIQIILFLRSVRQRTQAVLQWPGLPIHWLYGNFHQHPLFGQDRTTSSSGDTSMSYLLGMVDKFPGSYYFIYGPFQPTLVAVHPDVVRPIMKSRDPKPLEAGNIGYNYLLPWLGKGLLLAKGNKWARNRRLLTPAFHFDILKPYMAVYNDATEILLEKMDKFKDSGRGLKVTENISLCTLDILLRCVFSQKSNCQQQGENHPYVAAVERLSHAVLDRIFNLHLIFDWVYLNFSSRGRMFAKDCKFVHQVSDDVIRKRRKELEEEKGTQPTHRKYLDFLDILLSARDEDGSGLTDLEIRSEVDTFLFEGHDTTASGLTWMLYCLAKYPEHQKKAQQEIDDILNGRESDAVEWDDLVHLKHLTLCMKESLRMYPPVSFISRKLEKDLDVDGKVLPAGLHVDILIYSLHHNPEIWEDHMEFIPDRFLPENIQKKDAFAYIPFSAGPRNCIGQSFAMNEEKVILARILRKYDLKLDPTHEVKYSLELILKAEDDVKILVTERKS